MPRFAIADALTDFGVRTDPKARSPGPAGSFATDFAGQAPADLFPGIVPAPVAPPAPSVDIDALVAAAVAEAEAALTQRLTDEHTEAFRTMQEHHAEEIAALERRFGDEASEKIVARFAELESRVVELTGAVVARILGATLTDDIRDRSLERLATLIREALSDGEAVRIRLHGSLPLFEALKERLPEHGGQLDFTERPDFDLSVTIDDSVYETRLAEWSTALAETLE